jgi:hypothetical protein
VTAFAVVAKIEQVSKGLTVWDHNGLEVVDI